MDKFRAGVFGGGGSNGDWQAGRLLALKEDGVKFDVLTGTSVGALNSLAVAAGMTDILLDIWTNLKRNQVMKKGKISRVIRREALSHIRLAKEQRSIHDSRPLRKLLGELFLGKRCNIDYFCSVVVIGDHSPNIYLKHHVKKGSKINDNDLDMVWASTAIPGVFEEVRANGMRLYDGGVLQATPIRHTIREFPTTHMTIVLCQPLGKKNVKVTKGLVGRAKWVLETMLRDQFETEIKGMKKWNNALRQWEEKLPDEDLIINGRAIKYIETDIHAPDKSLGDPLNFNSSKTRPNFYAGYNSYKA
jgi:predicted acylesterase/phospholipase RssA